MKQRLLLYRHFLLLLLASHAACRLPAQDTHWMIGTWHGTGTTPGSNYSTNFSYTLIVDRTNKNEFRGKVIEEVPDNRGTRQELAVNGIVIGNQVIISVGRILYKKEPPTGYWADCSSCQTKTSDIRLSHDSILLIFQTRYCSSACDGIVRYYRPLSSEDSATQVAIVQRLATPEQAKSFIPMPAPITDAEQNKKVTDDGLLQAAGVSPVDKTITAANITANAQHELSIQQLARKTKTIADFETSDPLIKIELFDNGEIDGDSVTVYHNKEKIIDKQLLGIAPIQYTVKADASNNLHEFILVADNLGRIPPNTALMRIITGKKIIELYPSTDLSQNATVRIRYTGN